MATTAPEPPKVKPGRVAQPSQEIPVTEGSAIWSRRTAL